MDAQDVERIKDVFDRIYETDALIVKPAVGAELARCQEDLHSIGVPELPADVIEFLEIANGVAWNGFEFYGTYQVTVNKTGYTLRDIVSINQDWHERKMGLTDQLVLGTFDDDLYVYHSRMNCYRILDQMTLTQIDSCRDFAELFIGQVGSYCEEEEEYPPDDEDASRDEEENADGSHAWVEETESGLELGYEDYNVPLFDGRDYEATYRLGLRAKERLRTALTEEGFTGTLSEMIIARFGERLEKESFAAYCKDHDITYKLFTWIS